MAGRCLTLAQKLSFRVHYLVFQEAPAGNARDDGGAVSVGRRCNQCNQHVTEAGARFCPFCGKLAFE